MLIRAYGRLHAIRLMNAGPDVVVRETAASALRLSAEALSALGYSATAAEEAVERVRLQSEGLVGLAPLKPSRSLPECLGRRNTGKRLNTERGGPPPRLELARSDCCFAELTAEPDIRVQGNSPSQYGAATGSRPGQRLRAAKATRAAFRLA